MRVFKTTYRDRQGKKRKAAKWYVEFKDHLDTTRRLPGFTSKAATEEMGRRLEQLVAYHRMTGGQTDPALADWLKALAPRTRKKLVEIGLIGSQLAAVSKPLTEHLEDYGRSLTARGCTERHVAQVIQRVRRVFEECGLRYFPDIRPTKVADYLHGLRQDAEGRRGLSIQTFNFYLSALKAFCRWAVRDRRAAESPVANLEPLNVKVDRRHDRRPLSAEELRALLVAAVDGPTRYHMSGTDRAVLYQLAVETGLRSGELRSLTKISFALDSDPPTVTVAAGYSKRRRADTVLLRRALAERLRGFLAGKPDQGTVFAMPSREHVVRMFRADLSAAGIPYKVQGPDGPLFADFHSLRHTLISLLAEAGVHPKTAQAMARHSSITLTLDRYTHLARSKELQALEVLPDLSGPAKNPAPAAADDAAGAPAVLADCLARTGRPDGTPVDASEPEGADGETPAGAAGTKENTPNPSKNTGEMNGRGGGGKKKDPGRGARGRAPGRRAGGG